MMGIVWAILIGALVGAIAKLLMPGKDGGGFWITAALGIAGSLLAKFCGQAIGWYQEGQSAGFIASLLGAIALLAIYRMITKRGAAPAKS
jgi:uncharacterized membrane protein YeaQ/YmgE (transglycosylase-associated protein family)